MGRVVVVVDHGSVRPEANRASEAVAATLAERLGDRVIATHMELAAPLYADVLASMVTAADLDEVLVVPLFFVAGKHWHDDIVAPLERLRAARPTLRVNMLAPLTAEAAFVDFLAARIGAR